ncbi:AI-2E family transporter [Microcella daejeonensis]|uniref:AI-2E family transporter n=1 Tax=Microcella daejeonensis TaxID=2994971 RepID=UPI00227201F8|nr:AI-2E family transporter [Microcella daejeonensis]WAB85168.1 AI-2E family transporter [Microcella daejeonensis]
MLRRRRSNEPEAPLTDGVPPGMRIAGAWSWRLLAITAVIGVVIFLVMQLALLVIPIFVAVLLAALLQPLNGWLQRIGWPKWLSVTASMLALLGVVSGLIWLVVSQIRMGLPALEERAIERFDEIVGQISSTFGISEDEIQTVIDDTIGQFDLTDDWFVSGALSVGSTVGEVLTGAVLALFTLLFLLLDGRRIWTFVLGLLPKQSRKAVDGGATAGWLTVTNFAKVQIFVAFVDAVGIGLGALFLQLPLALPIAVAVFLGSFIPIIGAVVTGALAVVVALVFYGPVQALIMLGIVLLVQQIEGNILQPLVMGSVVKVHPLAVVLAVAAGGFLAGIPGTLFAVPIVAFLNVSIRYIASGAWRTRPRPTMDDLAAITHVDDGRGKKTP